LTLTLALSPLFPPHVLGKMLFLARQILQPVVLEI
jgi:hypothetical protein